MIDYTERMTEELKELLQQYEILFGYDPRGEESYNLSYDLENEKDTSYKDLVDVLKKCVKNKKDIFHYWKIYDDDW